MQKQHQFLLFPALLLLLLCSQRGQCMTFPSSTPSPTTSTPSRPLPPSSSPGTTVRSPEQPGGGRGQTNAWIDNIATVMENLAGALTKASSDANNGSSASAEALMDLFSHLPGIFQPGQGRGATGNGNESGGSENGNDVGQLLTSLFADPRAQSTPSWIEALLRGTSNSSLATAVQQLVQAFGGQQGNAQQLETLLLSLFQNVSQGLTSLQLPPGSSIQDVLSAITKNPSLISSMPPMIQTMLGSLSNQTGLQNGLLEALKQQFPVDPSSQCAADLLALGQALQQRQIWALKMLDAMGKIPPGILEGMNNLFGDYSECSSISHTDPLTNHNIEGLFCGMAIKTPEILSSLGVVGVIGLHTCLPSSCSDYDRYQMLQPAIQAIGSQYYVGYCYTPPDPSGDASFAGAVAVFCILAALCAAGTLYGVIIDCRSEKNKQYSPELPQTATTGAPTAAVNTYTNQAYTSESPAPVDCPTKNGDPAISAPTNGEAGSTRSLPPPYDKVPPTDPQVPATTGANQSAALPHAPSKPKEGLGSQLLLSFSVLRNGRKVLACTQNPSDVSCLHGIRVLSITWIILGHSYSQVGENAANRTYTAKLLSEYTFSVIPGALLGVDTFFLLSGCLTSFLFLKATKKSGLTVDKLVLYYVHRIWRLTPLYAVVLAYYIGIFPYTKEGPFQNLQGMDSEGEQQCRKYWYHNLLYINNVVDHKLERMCLGWSWYLSNDMQFHVIAPIILIPWALSRNRRVVQVIGHVLAVALIAVHSITSGIISADKDCSIFKNNEVYMDKVYFTPWCRVGPYAVGLLLGFIMHKTPRTYKMPKWAVFLGWALAWAVGVTVVYVYYDNVKDLMHGVRWNTAQTAAFEAMAKWVWALCVAWVIFACYTGYGGFVNTLLSWSAWQPLSRLTYGVYLVHLIVMMTLLGNMKDKFYVDAWTGTMMMMSLTVLSFLSSFVFCMLIEAPTLGLEKAVLGKIFKKKS